MVKFKTNYGAHIAKNLIYLDYDKLKLILHEHDKDEESSKKSKLQPLIHRKVEDWATTEARFSATFFAEVDRVDRCYVDHTHELDYFQVDMMRLAKECSENKFKKKEEKKAFEAALKRSTTTLHQKVTKLETYRILNRTLALKILQKHDKMTKKVGEKPVLESYLEKMNKTSLGSGAKLQTMHAQIESTYAELFCHGILEEAQGKLRLDKTLTNPQVLQLVWFKVGIIVTLLMWIDYNMMTSPRLCVAYLTMKDPSAYVYAAVAALITYRWFWGFSVYMWDSVDIDYILILDLDANKHMPRYDSIYSDAGTLTILFLTNVLMFDLLRTYHEHDTGESQTAVSQFIRFWGERAWIMPLLLIVGTLARMSYSMLNHTSRGVFSNRIFKQLATAPYVAVHLRHSYAADILCSLNKVFVSVIFSVCYFGSGSFLYASDPTNPASAEKFSICTTHPGMVFLKVLIMILPYFIRLVQCLRQRRDHFVRLHMASLPKLPPPDVVQLPSEESSQQDQVSVSVSPAPGNSVESSVDRSSLSSRSRKKVDMELKKRSVFFNAIVDDEDNTFADLPSPVAGKGQSAVEYQSDDEADCVQDQEPAEHDQDRQDEVDLQDNLDLQEEIARQDVQEEDEFNEGNNYGFAEDDAVNPLEHAMNPLHAPSVRQRSHRQYSEPPYVSVSTSTAATATSAAAFSPTRSSRGVSFQSTARVPATYSEKSSSESTPLVEMGALSSSGTAVAPPGDSVLDCATEASAAEYAGPTDGPNGKPKMIRRTSSFNKTFSEGLEITRKIRAGLRSSLSRSEVHDLPMPHFVAAVAKCLPKAFTTIFVWPYSYNALRYFLSILVILFGAYPPQDPLSPSYMGCFYTLYVVSTLFNVYWDVANDFQLLQFHSTRPLLRDNLLYSDAEYFYYAVLIINPILRFLWTLNFTPYGNQAFLMLFEIMRRSLWACLRMELGYIQELARRR